MCRDLLECLRKARWSFVSGHMFMLSIGGRLASGEGGMSTRGEVVEFCQWPHVHAVDRWKIGFGGGGQSKEHVPCMRNFYKLEATPIKNHAVHVLTSQTVALTLCSGSLACDR